MIPTERRDVLQQSISNISTRSLHLCDCTVEIDCIPVDDRTDDEVETRGAECSAFERPITDFAALVEEDSAFQLMRCLGLVEAGLTAPPQCWTWVPFDHEERTLNPTEFAERPREMALLRRCGQFLEDRKRHHGPRRDRRREMEQIVPMFEDQGGVDRRPDVVRQGRICIALLERVELPIL